MKLVATSAEGKIAVFPFPGFEVDVSRGSLRITLS
jgi:hypothetical protein